ncbi:MAG: hypothetical protein KF856_09430 [Cyclobacteriaceae bacterium]|nr:hypothetical protein [Cyclobacteriaceae bacterium]
MYKFFFVILLVNCSLAWGQTEFNYEALVGDKILYLTGFKGKQVDVDVRLTSPNATVLIVVEKEKSFETFIISVSAVKSINTTDVKRICVIHREKK